MTKAKPLTKNQEQTLKKLQLKQQEYEMEKKLIKRAKAKGKSNKA